MEKETNAEKVQRFTDEVSNSSSKRLARGNVLLQMGLNVSEAEMEQRKKEHPARIARLKEIFGL